MVRLVGTDVQSQVSYLKSESGISVIMRKDETEQLCVDGYTSPACACFTHYFIVKLIRHAPLFRG